MQMLHMTMDSTNTRPQWRTSLETAPTCPRCASPNTKFCYYNNYSLSQPRYFCKGCRRYWTKGGSLRNVPVGGGCRKNRRLKAAARAVAQQPSCSSPDYSNDPNSLLGGNSNSNNGGVSAEEPSNIDLAVIFANYLNQSPSEASASSGGGQTASDMSSPELTHVSAEGNSRERLEESHEHELEGFDLQGLLEGSNDNNEKLGEDMIWYEDASCGHSTWQRMAQLQEMQAFLLDDQTRLNPDGIGWSTFDLSTF